MVKRRASISQEFYDKLVTAFRSCPGNYTQAAKKAGCDKRTARRAWHRAWPERGDWCRPIKDVLAVEKIDAAQQARIQADRAALAAEQARERKRMESEKAHEEELQMLKVARGDVLAVLGMAMELIPVMREVGQILKEAVAKDANGKRVKDISPVAAMSLLTRHAQIVQKGVGCAEALVQLSRLERGASTVNVGPAVPDEHLSYEDALQELEALGDVLQGARAVGLLARAGAHDTMISPRVVQAVPPVESNGTRAHTGPAVVRRRSLLDGA